MKAKNQSGAETLRRVIVMTNRMTTDCHARLAGIRRYLDEHETGWEPQFFMHADALTAGAVREAVRRGTNGFIADLSVGSDILDALARIDIPTVTIDVRGHRVCRRTRNFVSICCDDEEVARAGMRHFLDQGRFHAFGFCAGGIKAEWAAIRTRVFRQALSENGLFCHVFDPVGMTAPSGRDLVRWLRTLPKPAAVMAVNDDTAAKILRAAADAKLKVPQQLAVLGSDNDELVCENTHPTISSVPPDFEEEGYRAAVTLDALMSGRRPTRPNPILVPLRPIVVRDSSASISPADFLVRKALQFIDKNACRGIGVDDVARHVGVSRRLLYLRFREIRNETVLDAIQTRRLDEVRRRLTSTRETIAVLAADCGFDNENYLMRLFKARFGVTLRAYRLSHLNKSESTI